MTTLTDQGFSRSVAALLREELGFYRSLYVLLDRQRDWLKYERDSRILDIFNDIEKLKTRIQGSQEKIFQLSQKNGQLFQQALETPEVARLAENIVSLINKCVEVVGENESIAKAKRNRLKAELADLAKGERLYSALKHPVQPRYVDEKK